MWKKGIKIDYFNKDVYFLLAAFCRLKECFLLQRQTQRENAFLSYANVQNFMNNLWKQNSRITSIECII